MIHKFFFIFVIMMILSCTKTIIGEGAATVKQEFKFDQQFINQLDLSCSNCNAILIPSDKNLIKIESHQNLINNIIISSDKEKISIKEKNNVTHFSAYDIYIFLRSDSIKSLYLDKHSSLRISGTLKTNNLKIKIKNNSFINESYLIVDTLKLKAENQSKINLNGFAHYLDLESSNKANINLLGIEIDNAFLSAKNETNIRVNMKKYLDGNIKDNARIFYKGTPIIDITSNDSSSINKEE